QVWTDKDFEMTMMNFFTLWEPDFLYYSLWNSEGAFNYRGVSDPEIDRLTTEARRVTDPEARAAIYREVQEIMDAQTHDVVLWFRNGSIGARPEVKGLDTIVHPNGSNLDFHRVWLEQ
ncbi:MAG: ABC transporter substrate-binding protein, partial [Pseudomonadota bacterium]